ncbi:MAG: HAD family hydrolase [Candidatus Micrarchaeota archaeon]
MKEIEAIIFDWDGTLCDSLHATYVTYEKLFAKIGVELPELEKFREEYECDYHSYYRKKNIGAERMDEVDGMWLKLFEEEAHNVSLYPSAKGVLASLKNAGIKMSIVSNGSSGRVKNELKKFGIDGYFVDVLGSVEIGEFKPSPQGLVRMMEKMGYEGGNGHAKKVAYVGDMVEDIHAGKRASIRTVAVLTGYHSEKKLRGAEPDYVLAGVEGLPKLLGIEQKK